MPAEAFILPIMRAIGMRQPRQAWQAKASQMSAALMSACYDMPRQRCHASARASTRDVL